MSELKNISKAICAVMKAVKGVDKTMTVGTGNNSYKGVSDQEVKKIIGAAMEKEGLCIVPVSVKPTVQVDRWEGKDYQGNPQQKQSVFTQVETKYLLIHSDSGESIELAGYGHGVDSQDKGAGKATTYALKYTLLYTFLVPTGKIDDADNEHSDEKPTPPARKQKEELTPKHPKWQSALQSLISGGYKISDIEKKYTLSEENKELLITSAASAQ